MELEEYLDACKKEGIRAVYITGAGKAFSAGQDISELVGEHKLEIKQILAEHYNPIVTRIRKTGEAGNCCREWRGRWSVLILRSVVIVVAAAGASFIQAFSNRFDT